MFSSETEEKWLGRILRKLNDGKTLGAILLEMDWTARAKLLLNIKKIKSAHRAFVEAIALTNPSTGLSK